MAMRRRLYINMLSSGLVSMVSGCSTIRSTGDSNIKVENFPDYDSLDVTFTGEVIQQLSDENPPRIELRFTNDGPERKMAFGPVAPFTGLGDEDETLVLIPDTREPLEAWDPDVPDTFVPESRKDGCWRTLHTPARRPYFENTVLDTGEQRIEQYTLLAQADAESCFPSGTYRFENKFKIKEIHTLSLDVVVP